MKKDIVRIWGWEFQQEHKFHPVRKWRFDYANTDCKIAIEIEGGVFSNGRHTRAAGYIGDCEKYNQAQLLGWIVLRYPSMKKVSPVDVGAAFRSRIKQLTNEN